MITTEDVKKQAQVASKYQNKHGDWHTMKYCDDDHFVCVPDWGDIIDDAVAVNYSEVTFEGHECFWRIIKMEVPQ